MTKIGKILLIRHIKGDSNLISGVTRKSAIKLEKNQNAYGGNGTYRVNTKSKLEFLVQFADKTQEFVNAKKIVYIDIGIRQLTEKRKNILNHYLIGKEIAVEENDFGMSISDSNKVNKTHIEVLKTMIWYTIPPQMRGYLFAKILK